MSIHLFIQHKYNEITIIKFSVFWNKLSIMGSRLYCDSFLGSTP